MVDYHAATPIWVVTHVASRHLIITLISPHKIMFLHKLFWHKKGVVILTALPTILLHEALFSLDKLVFQSTHPLEDTHIISLIYICFQR